MKPGDLVKHIAFGIGLVYQVKSDPQDQQYWKAVGIFRTQDLAKCLWIKENVIRMDSWVAQYHLEVIDDSDDLSILYKRSSKSV